MSSHQKTLKIMSFVLIIAALGMAVWTGMSLMFANTSEGLLLALCALVPTLLDAVLGAWGVGVANRPSRGGAYYVGLTWLALVLNAVAVVVFLLMDGMVWPSVANLVVVALYLYYSRAVRLESLR